jgi:hypothetical protein
VGRTQRSTGASTHGALDEPTGSGEEFASGLDRVRDGVGVLVRPRVNGGGRYGRVPFSAGAVIRRRISATTSSACRLR